jgi:hypothetical protein
LLFRKLATLRTDITLFDDVDELRWRGPTFATGSNLLPVLRDHCQPANKHSTPPISINSGYDEHGGN